MSAFNRLGAAIAISSLTLAMFGCSDQNNGSSAPQTQAAGTSDSASKNSIEFTPINTLSISDYSLDLCIKNTGRTYIEEITTLMCNNKGIQLLDGIGQLTELKTLHLNFNNIEDINPLVELKKLNTLYLSGNQIQNLEPLSELAELTELAIQKNNIQDLSPLQSMGSLKSLHTHSNKIYDFSVLNELNLDILSGQNQQDS
ncbi:MAG: leucine-rich repeat domain-containing protein [Oleispira sp.]|nr:leucine-rich repeat domain-containing protein [Oleispira sp.]MBL4882606.1 leucine-rich repeat domain-containing protein [Oleispira sp.]